MTGAIHYPRRGMAGGNGHEHGSYHVGQLARGSWGPRGSAHPRATRPVDERVRVPAAVWDRLLLQPLAQPLPGALSVGAETRPDRAPARHQPLDRFQPPGALQQGGGPRRPPPYGRSVAWQTLAPL